MKQAKPSKKGTERPSRERKSIRGEQEEQKRRRREELGIKLPEPLKPWDSVDTISKKVVPLFEKGEHPLLVAKELGLNKATVRPYWWRWRHKLGI